jgi:hypothetical protein
MTPAYERGQQAFNDSTCVLLGNPYRAGTDEHEDWVQGFQQQWFASLEEEHLR